LAVEKNRCNNRNWSSITPIIDGQMGNGRKVGCTDRNRPCAMPCHFDSYRGALSVVAGLVAPDAGCDHWRTVDDQLPEPRGLV
jgi:hypothetical protein